MDVPNLTIYNLPPSKPNWDRIGVFYISFCATWTTIIMACMAFCLYNRHLPVLRVRGLWLSFGAVTFLHLYWIMAQIVYPIGATLPVVIAYDVQYFVMGMWFPLGIALFHAANLRFLRVAKLQKQYTMTNVRRKRGCDGAHTSWFCKIRNMEYNLKTMTFIGIGMVFQCILCVSMWFACKKYHPSFGIPGTEIKGATLPEQFIDLGRGWEWWPSVVWQLIWTWIVAPVLIWRAWNIHDTMGWRTQTIGACLSGLHAIPMFLIASYVPEFYTSKLNSYFPPSQWIHLNTMFIEIFTVFIPTFQVVKLWALHKKIAANNARWEAVSPTSDFDFRKDSKGSIDVAIKEQILECVVEGLDDRLLTLGALNRVLADYPAPLQEFSACNDFSGENIAFLTRVADWKTECSKGKSDNKHLAEAYNIALNLYIDFISPRDAQFPLNISSAQLTDLEAVFERQARIMCGEARVDPALPFAFEMPPSRASNGGSDTTLQVSWYGGVPESFHKGVFDAVERHIKDLVLTNTWPKFVREMQSRRRSSMDSERSDATDQSKVSVMSQITRFMRGLV